MQQMVNLGFGIGLAIWTFVMGGFYGLINFGGDFIQWLNVAFLGLAPTQFNTLVDALQSAGAFICFIIWIGGVVLLYTMRHMGNSMFKQVGNAPRRSSTVGGPTIDGQSREL